MAEKTWLDYVTALGAVATPVLVLLLTAVGWRLRARLERRFALEDNLREDRVEAYNAILEPFVILLTSDAAWNADPKNRGRDKSSAGAQKIMSLDYRRNAFRLSFVGSDDVVRAYNNLMQYFYQHKGDGPSPGEGDMRDMMALLGHFLLEIRRSMGNEGTHLDHWEMLEWFVTDVRKFRR